MMYLPPHKIQAILPTYLSSNKLATYRQGDILLMQKDSLPQWRRQLNTIRGRVILAKSAITIKGLLHRQPQHCHYFAAPNVQHYRECGTGNIFIAIENGPAELLHQEHYGISVPAGIYRVIRQRQWHPKTPRFAPD